MLFWTHLAAGCVAGVVVLIMSATGVLLTYQKQMTSWADLRGVDRPSLPKRALPLSADSLLVHVRSTSTVSPTGIVWRRGDQQPVELVLPQNRRLFVDAYSGAALGTGSTAIRSFFRGATELHRWLGMSGDGRKTGRAITGVSNLAFLVLVLTGMILWWPRVRTAVSFRNIARFRRGLRGKAREFNWHNVLGIWSALPLVVVVTSGVVISYAWAGDLVYLAAGEAPPRRAERAAPASIPTTAVDEAAPAPMPQPIDHALRSAQARVPTWRTISLTIPRRKSDDLTLTVDRGYAGEPHKRAQLSFRPDGQVARWQQFSDQSTARRWRSILRFAHTGEVFGLTGQTIAGLVSLVACVLVYTGLALSLRRWLAWTRRRRNGGSAARHADVGKTDPQGADVPMSGVPDAVA